MTDTNTTTLNPENIVAGDAVWLKDGVRRKMYVSTIIGNQADCLWAGTNSEEHGLYSLVLLTKIEPAPYAPFAIGK